MDDDLNSSTNPQPPPLTAEEKEILESDKIGEYFDSLNYRISTLIRPLLRNQRFSEKLKKFWKGTLH